MQGMHEKGRGNPIEVLMPPLIWSWLATAPPPGWRIDRQASIPMTTQANKGYEFLKMGEGRSPKQRSKTRLTPEDYTMPDPPTAKLEVQHRLKKIFGWFVFRSLENGLISL